MQVTPWNDRLNTKIAYEAISSLHVEHPLQTTQQHHPNSAASLRPVRYPQNHPSLSHLKCPRLNMLHAWAWPSVRMMQPRLWPLLKPSSIIAPWQKDLKRLNSDERAGPYTYSQHTRCPIKHPHIWNINKLTPYDCELQLSFLPPIHASHPPYLP